MKSKTVTPAPKIPKGFVLVNLTTYQQEELRQLAHESGVNLKMALGWALTQIREDLKRSAELRRKTGMTRFEWCRRMGCRMDYNEN